MTAVPEGGEFDFDAETRLLPGSADGTFQVEISDRWSGIASVNGGFLMATCLKALAAAAPFPDPVTVSGFYLRPGRPGPADVTAELIRAGRTTSFGQASLLQAGKEVLRVTAAFADLSTAPSESGVTPQYMGATPPKLPAPEECLRVGGILGISMARRFEYRVLSIPGWITGKPSGEPFAEFWIRFADGRPADTLTLPFIVDACPPAVLELGVSSTTIELTVHVRARPAPGWLACRTSTRFVSSGYHEEDFEVWDCTGALVAQSRQLALVRPFDSLFLRELPSSVGTCPRRAGPAGLARCRRLIARRSAQLLPLLPGRVVKPDDDRPFSSSDRELALLEGGLVCVVGAVLATPMREMGALRRSSDYAVAAKWSAAKWSAAKWSAAKWSAAKWSAAKWSGRGRGGQGRGTVAARPAIHGNVRVTCGRARHRGGPAEATSPHDRRPGRRRRVSDGQAVGTNAHIGVAIATPSAQEGPLPGDSNYAIAAATRYAPATGDPAGNGHCLQCRWRGPGHDLARHRLASLGHDRGGRVRL